MDALNQCCQNEDQHTGDQEQQAQLRGQRRQGRADHICVDV